jgi:hypothetical protein
MSTSSRIMFRSVYIVVVVALAASAAGVESLRAQDTVRDTAKSAPAPRPPASSSASAVAARPVSTASKSLPQRVFDTPWVLFPTRLTIVIVLIAVSVLFLMSGCWGAVRFAHLLRHMEWKEPPRRLKRGELGAAGASLGFEFEERLNVKREQDEERDRQIAWLRTSVLRLTADHNRTAAALAMITEPGEGNLSHGEADDLG